MFYHSEKPSSTKLFDTVIHDIDRTQNDMIKHIYIINVQEFDDKFVTGHLKMHHQWAPQNAPPCVVDNLPFCL